MKTHQPQLPVIGPLPAELYIEVTNRCNSQCQTCIRTFETLEPLRDLDLDEFRALVDQVPDLRRAVLHGVGEPLLNHDLPAMVAHLKRRTDPPQVLFNSNAILLTAEWQAALMHAGLDEFRISTDAAQPELYARIRGVDAFERMAGNVRTFAQRIRRTGFGPRLSLWYTAMHENLADMQTAEESLLAEAEMLAEEFGIAFRASGTTSPRDSLLSADGKRRPWSQCRRPSSLMYITANGNVLPCCFSPFTTRDYSGLILANAFQRPLDEIWTGAAYRQFRAAQHGDAPPEACDRCGVCWSL
jgi:MoaA/NifB/PqqE/SkfB family radical SAM enzyme